MNPLVSVIIPVYNRSDALKKTLDSVIFQTYSNFEIWVIDDGSTEDIYAVIKEIDDKRIFYHKLEHNNANVARNYGINNCNGEYIAMLDSDDTWLENHLESCLNVLLSEKKEGLYGSLLLKNSNNQQSKFTCRPLYEDESMVDYLLRMGCGAQTSTLFMTAKSAKDILWDPEIKRHQDYDFVIRYSKKYEFAVKTEPTVIYLNIPKKNVDYVSCIQVIRKYKKEISPDIYSQYNMRYLQTAIRDNAPSEIIEYYKKETTSYKEYLSFSQYLIIKKPRTWIQWLKCKFSYIYYILMY